MAGPYPTNHLVMTAPRPRLHHRLFNDNESSTSGSSFDSGDPEEIIRKNLFAPPLVVQNEIFRTKSMANNHHQHQMIHQRPSTSHQHRPSTGHQHRPSTGVKPRQTIRTNSPMKVLGQGSTCSKMNRRTGSDEFCGLSAEIYRAIANRTPLKTATAVETPMRPTDRSVLKAPVSRDLFCAKSSVSAFPPTMDRSTPTNSSDSGSSDRESQCQSMLVTKKRELDSTNTPTTLPSKKQKMRKTPFATSSARKKLLKCLTPPRNTFGSHMKLHRASSAAAATLSSSFAGVDDYRLTSTEQDPSPFQVELPSKREVLVYTRICALMDGYTAVHRDFNFAMLSGVSHSTLRKEYERSTPEKPIISGSCHRDVVKELLECADDIVVEGFFREYTEEEKDKESERIEACILSSEGLRQIIVCFRGSTTNQAKPLRNSLFGKQGA